METRIIEPENSEDKYAVAVVDIESISGDLPKAEMEDSQRLSFSFYVLMG